MCDRDKLNQKYFCKHNFVIASGPMMGMELSEFEKFIKGESNMTLQVCLSRTDVRCNKCGHVEEDENMPWQKNMQVRALSITSYDPKVY